MKGKGLAALFCVLLLAWPAFGASFGVRDVPNPHLRDASLYVSDPEGILPPESVMAINQEAAELERSLGVQLAVVALRDIGENEARSFATDLFNHWGLGQKDKDNGLLILLVTDPAQRSVIFETGYGLEGVLPDAVCYRLQQRYMVPDLRGGNYGEGMRKGVAAVSQYLAANSGERAAMAAPPEQNEEEPGPLTLVLLFLLVILLLRFGRNMGGGGGFGGGGFFGGGGGFGGGGFGGGFGGGGSWGGGSSGGGGARSGF